MDGLLWVQEHKIELVAYGAKKLKLTMIVEDDKVINIINSLGDYRWCLW